MKKDILLSKATPEQMTFLLRKSAEQLDNAGLTMAAAISRRAAEMLFQAEPKSTAIR